MQRIFSFMYNDVITNDDIKEWQIFLSTCIALINGFLKQLLSYGENILFH